MLGPGSRLPPSRKNDNFLAKAARVFYICSPTLLKETAELSASVDAIRAAAGRWTRVTPKLGESGMSQVSWKGVWLVDFPRRRAANLNQGWDGSPGRSRRVDRLAEAADCGA